VNTIGQGSYSSTVKCQTKCLPPDAPQLECVTTTCNSIKLKWNTVNHIVPTVINTTEQTVSTRIITYIIEMEGKDGK
jgi:hypothetical protein